MENAILQETLAPRGGERVTLIGGIPPKDKDAATVAFEMALVQKLKAILERPLSSQVLLELEVSSRLGRQFLMVSEGPAAIPRQGFGTGGVFGGFGDSYGGFESGAILPVSPPAETWGAGVLRELVAKVGEINKRPPSLGDIMDAMRMAEKAGKTDIVAKLQKELDRQLSSSAEETDAPVPLPYHSPLLQDDQGDAA